MGIWQFLNENAVAVCIVLCIVALIFIMFGHVYREQVQQALKQEFLRVPEGSLDWWSVSHLCLYAIFGFLIPNYHTTFFLAGTCFEIVEDMLSSDATTQLADCMSPNTKASNIMCQFSINDDYWYSATSDIYVNLIGYTLGSSLRTTFIR
jgi:hypothetical protein